jgi:hypothetical protein
MPRMQDREQLDDELYDGCVPDPNTPLTIESPWMRAVTWSAMALLLAGFLLGGWPGLLGATGAVILAVFGMPDWTPGNVIERSEAKWIAKSLQKHHDKYKAKPHPELQGGIVTRTMRDVTESTKRVRLLAFLVGSLMVRGCRTARPGG